MRMAFIFLVVVPILVWAVLCFVRREMIELPWSIVGLIAAALGGKVGQRIVENYEPRK